MSRSGFTFNNIDSSQFGIYADHKRVLFPSIKSREVQIPGKKGSIDFGTRFSARLVEVACYVAGDEVEDLKDTLSQIRAWLDPSNGERVLIFDNDPDWYYKARYTGQIPLSYFVSGASFTIPFKCSDPFIYSINPTEIEEVVTTSPKVIPIDLSLIHI